VIVDISIDENSIVEITIVRIQIDAKSTKLYYSRRYNTI